MSFSYTGLNVAFLPECQPGAERGARFATVISSFRSYAAQVLCSYCIKSCDWRITKFPGSSEPSCKASGIAEKVVIQAPGVHCVNFCRTHSVELFPTDTFLLEFASVTVGHVCEP